MQLPDVRSLLRSASEAPKSDVHHTESQCHHLEFRDPASISGERMFGVLSALRYLLSRIAPQSQWPQRVAALLADYRDIPTEPMGFPVNWTDYPLWQR